MYDISGLATTPTGLAINQRTGEYLILDANQSGGAGNGGGARRMDGVVRLSASVSGEEAYGWSSLPDGLNPGWRGKPAGYGRT